MPELPEVETIKNDLQQIVGRRITGVALLDEKIVRRPSASEFRQRLVGQTIGNIGRRGKYLLFHLSGGEVLVLHLKMSGIMLLRAASAPPEAYTRAVFHLDDGAELRFCDRRRFAAAWLVKDEADIVGGLGPEPLEGGFTAEALGQLLRRHNIAIKALLLDQNIIAGIGNMYADEVLFAARIHPLRKSSELSWAEVKRLHRAIRQVLKAAIVQSGASVDTYKRPSGEPGTAHFFFKVAHRKGGLCYRCRTPIERIVVRGRGTYFCPRCQGGRRPPLPRRRGPAAQN